MSKKRSRTPRQALLLFLRTKTPIDMRGNVVPVPGKLPGWSENVPVSAPCWRSHVVRPKAVSTPRMSALMGWGSLSGIYKEVSAVASGSWIRLQLIFYEKENRLTVQPEKN
jgi:hypothetical protein